MPARNAEERAAARAVVDFLPDVDRDLDLGGLDVLPAQLAAAVGADEAAALGAHVTGIDVSSGMLEVARQRSHAGIVYLLAEAAALPFGDGSVEIVALVPMGRPRVPFRVGRRRPAEQVTHWDRFGNKAR